MVGLTRAQLLVIDALINGQAEAARALADLTMPLQIASQSGDRAGWQEAEAAHKQALERCAAFRLALHVARETFQKANQQHEQ